VGDPDPVLLLVNPSAGAGRAREVLPEAERALSERGISHRTVLTESLEHGCAEARSAAENGEIVAVCSGDGLIGQIGGALARTPATMALIPGGRGNDLARALGIPVDPVEAVELLAAGPVREIDVGEVNGRRFLCIASCGFDSDANRIANQTKWIRGQAVYLYAALRALTEWKPARFRLTLDGEETAFTGYGVAAANTKAYGGGMYVAPGADPDDGLLDVVWMEDTGKLRFLANVLPKVFKGTHVRNREVVVRQARELRIDADRPFEIYADGDHLADLPATVRLVPRALRVIAPATAPDLP
jgi:YegS/Rv2252/BmrU family lipid kinase